MAISKKPSSRSSGSSGSSLGLIIPIVLIIGVLAGGGYYFFFRSTENSSTKPLVADTNPTTPVSSVADNSFNSTVTPASMLPIDQLSVEQLLKEASNAFREGRREAPAGKNALEYYIKALEKDPQNKTAKNALLEIFPLATDSVGKVINNGQLDEANRLIDLLAKSDPNNYTLTILRSKLQVKKKQLDREEAQAAALAATTPATAAPHTTTSTDTTPVTNPSHTEPNAQPPTTTATVGNTAAPTPNLTPPKPIATASTTSPAATTSETITPPPPANKPQTTTGETHEVQVVRTTPPEYPRDAVRKRQQGWVEVAFTVTADGQIADVQIINSDPPKVFDREAIRAVQRWTFKPKMQNGVAVPGRVQRRLEFKLDS